MAVAGDLADFGVPDLLYMIKMRGMSGRLTLRRGDDDAALHFQGGRLIRVASSRVSQRLGELLVYLGRLTEEQLSAALTLQTERRGAESLGALLIGQGLVTTDDLDDVLRCQAEEILYRVLAWAEGHFDYAPTTEATAAVPLPEINVEKLILEAIRQGDEWEELRRRIPGLDCAVLLNGQPTDALFAPLSLKESIVVASVARGATSLREVAQATRLAEPELLRLVDELANRGVLTVTAPPAPAAETQPLTNDRPRAITRTLRRRRRPSRAA